MDTENGAEKGKEPSVRRASPTKPHYHSKVYWGLLIFVVGAGMPIVSVPAARQRLRTRVDALKAAFRGELPPQLPALERVGENHEPFPREYEHPQAKPPILAKLEALQRRTPLVMSDQGDVPAAARPPMKMPMGSGGTVAFKDKPEAQAAAAGGENAQAAAPSGEPTYQKGKNEQEAYDILVNANQTLAAMIKGSDPNLKFQDWSAANMGENNYYVMVTFLQSSDKVARKYIWSVKVSSKEVTPLSSYAMSISK